MSLKPYQNYHALLRLRPTLPEAPPDGWRHWRQGLTASEVRFLSLSISLLFAWIYVFRAGRDFADRVSDMMMAQAQSGYMDSSAYADVRTDFMLSFFVAPLWTLLIYWVCRFVMAGSHELGCRLGVLRRA